MKEFVFNYGLLLLSLNTLAFLLSKTKAVLKLVIDIDHDIETYSIHKKGKSFVFERFIRTLKNKIFKCMHDRSFKRCMY